jgi:hypothetical protein
MLAPIPYPATTNKPLPGDVPQLVTVACSQISLASGHLAVACSWIQLELTDNYIQLQPVTCKKKLWWYPSDCLV